MQKNYEDRCMKMANEHTYMSIDINLEGLPGL